MGILVDSGSICQLKFGFQNEPALIQELLATYSAAQPCVQSPSGFSRRWAERLQEYASGHRISLATLPVDLTSYTPFQRKVLQVCREIPHGKTLTYGQLALQAGAPGAARAVGNVMRNNNIPLVIPCHRVVGSDSIGGYSAASGIALKEQLLIMEKARLPRRKRVGNRLCLVET
jgi:methylated-DNA-[protein]-cysteine S-methyltransferase